MVVSTKLIFLKYTESIYITHTHSKRMMNEASPIHALKVSGVSIYSRIVKMFGIV